jgi:ATP-binding cassette subfamily F protein uup
LSAVITVQGLAKSFGARHILADVSFAVDERDRIAVVGVNGSGKSTLLRLVAAARVSDDPADAPDAGVVTKRRGLSLEYVPQEPHLDPALSIEATLRLGLRAHAVAVRELEELDRRLPQLTGADLEEALHAHAALHDRLATTGGLERDHEVRTLAASLGLARLERVVGELSIGEKRRVAIGQALLASPEVLALDEPTNHLDAATVAWLEARLITHPGALLLVTHDRYFLDRVATRILELDRGRIHAYEGGYSRFLELQSERLEAASERERVRRAYVRRELDWIRRGPQARATKQKARIDRFDAAVAAGDDAKEPGPDERLVSLRLPPGPRLGKTVLELEGLGKSLGGKLLFRDLTFILRPGERLGIVGPNGAGKTTLVRVLLGLEPPDEGRLTVGVNTRYAFLDQGRAELDDQKSVLEEVGGGRESVELADGPVHVRTFLRLLLFDDAVAEQRVGLLSGGERNRLQLARMLRAGGNVLVLDEPTNDLDLMTLGVLEEALVDFPGCVLAVSHDRWFLDRVATSILALHGDGRVEYEPGNYASYLERRQGRIPGTEAARGERAAPARGRAAQRPARDDGEAGSRQRKLSYREQRELEGIEAAIELAETRQGELEATLADPTLYATRGGEVPGLVTALEATRAEVERLYERWQELERVKAGDGRDH